MYKTLDVGAVRFVNSRGRGRTNVRKSQRMFTRTLVLNTRVHIQYLKIYIHVIQTSVPTHRLWVSLMAPQEVWVIPHMS